MQYLTLAFFAGLSAAQLNIPTNVGAMSGLPSNCAITASGSKNVLKTVCRIPKGATVNLGNREFDRGMKCAPGDSGTANAVFVLEDGATIENAVIGADALEGIHCEGGCTVRNVWFRKVCEDAVSVLGTGDALIVGGGAQGATDKVIQHNNKGTVTIRDYTVADSSKLYRSCGDCSDNSQKGPRHVIIENLRATNVKTNLAGINQNFGDTATISGSCGTVGGEICQQFQGLNKTPGGPNSPEIGGKQNCLGPQGKYVKNSMSRC